MRLQGVIDAGVGGGASRYFGLISKAYDKLFPEISRAYVEQASELLSTIGVSSAPVIRQALKYTLQSHKVGSGSMQASEKHSGSPSQQRRRASSAVHNLTDGVSTADNGIARGDDALQRKDLVDLLLQIGNELERHAIQELRDALQEQMQLAKEGLQVHSIMRPDRLAPLHELLQKRMHARQLEFDEMEL